MKYHYVTVEYAGTDEEYITAEFRTADEAYAFANKIDKAKARRVTEVDVMKRLDDGALTTEF